MMDKYDHFRQLILQEPRGYPCQNVDFVFPPTPNVPDAAFSVVIGENNKVYPLSSGHNLICVCTALLETGMVAMKEPVTKFVLEVPGGRVEVAASCSNGKADSITFRNLPSFVGALDLEVDVPGGIGKVRVDVCFGGMWYAIVNPDETSRLGLEIVPEQGADIARLGEMIKVATREQHLQEHPDPSIDYPGPDIMAFRAPPSPQGAERHGAHSRNAVVMSTGTLDWDRPSSWTGNIDRSPCGSGTSAIMAAMYARNELSVGDTFVHESILGTIFTGKVIEENQVVRGRDGRPSIVIDVSGQAWITQHSRIVLDPSDPFPTGYTVGDIWA
jgi:proline racemase